MWYLLKNEELIDTPALAVYPERMKSNINLLMEMAGDSEKLRPHIKTNKSPQACTMMLEAGIKKFKCATIAEAELLASIGASDVVLAYQPTGPKILRLIELIKNYPNTRFSCLIDDLSNAKKLGSLMANAQEFINVWIDLNVGMNRTGISPELAVELFAKCLTIEGIRLIGLHAYDGHLRDADLEDRRIKCDKAYNVVENLKTQIEQQFQVTLNIIAGGSPTFPIHSKRKNVECSPGTFIYWDLGYGALLKEQPFLHAALVLSRVISKPSQNLLCLDLGHKSIAAENPLDKRVLFLNGPELIPVSQSEEHLVVQTDRWSQYEVGQLLYGIPFHVCPTIALYDFAWVVRDGRAEERWENIARNRRLII